MVEELHHHSIATKHPSGMWMQFGLGTLMSIAVRMPFVEVIWNTECRATAAGIRIYRRINTDPDSHYGPVVIVQPSSADPNPHSIQAHRTPIYGSRGFLHQSLSDACPISIGTMLKACAGGQASDNP